MKRVKIVKMSEQDRLRAAVRMILQQHDVSLRQLAESLGTGHSPLSLILSGKQDARFGTWQRIATSLNTTILDLLTIPDEVLQDFEAQRLGHPPRKTA